MRLYILRTLASTAWSDLLYSSRTAEANSTVELFEGTVCMSIAQAQASGEWSIALRHRRGRQRLNRVRYSHRNSGYRSPYGKEGSASRERNRHSP
jgi:hypothetical protein